MEPKQLSRNVLFDLENDAIITAPRLIAVCERPKDLHLERLESVCDPYQIAELAPCCTLLLQHRSLPQPAVNATRS